MVHIHSKMLLADVRLHLHIFYYYFAAHWGEYVLAEVYSCIYIFNLAVDGIFHSILCTGVARISNKYSHRLTPYVPKIYVFSSEGKAYCNNLSFTSSILHLLFTCGFMSADNSESLDHLVKWRRSSLRKPVISFYLEGQAQYLFQLRLW